MECKQWCGNNIDLRGVRELSFNFYAGHDFTYTMARCICYVYRASTARGGRKRAVDVDLEGAVPTWTAPGINNTTDRPHEVFVPLSATADWVQAG